MRLLQKSARTIIQTMLAGALIALMLAFALPGILTFRVSENESMVKQRLKSLSKKLQEYKFQSKIDSYPQDLNFMRNESIGNSQKKQFIAGELSFEYSGYWFVYLPAGRESPANIEKFTFFCRPIEQNVTGINSFVMDEGATVYLDIGKQPGIVDEFDQPVN